MLVPTRIGGKYKAKDWGSLFDIGHASAVGVRAPYRDLTEQVLDMIDKRIDRIVQFHVHGVAMIDGSLKAHQPLDEDNRLDYGRIVALMKDRGFEGPIIFEIARRGDRLLEFDEALEACLKAKELLTAA